MAEGAAELFLRAKGFEILERRYKTPVGEIDIIALDYKYLVFVEVKARASVDGALESITPKMRARINDAATHFFAAKPKYAGYPMRVDVVAVCGRPEMEAAAEVTWYPNAVQAGTAEDMG